MSDILAAAAAKASHGKSASSNGKPRRKRKPKPASDGRSVTRPEAQTDVANAQKFIELHGDNVRFCYPFKKWIVFDGKRWRNDNTGEIWRLAKTVADPYWQEARSTGDAAALRAAAKCASNHGINAFLKLAQSEVPILPADMDTNNWLLNCMNGTLDLRTGKLGEHCREDFITKLCPVEYNPDAVTFVWDMFLARTFDNRQSLIDYMQLVVGYFLTGMVSEQILLILWGIGANGKSTMLNAILDMLGPDYSMQAIPDLLMSKQNDRHPTERADLHGKRFVSCVETEDNRALAESLVKQLTGGERVRARRMKEDFWEFSPTHKIVLTTNHKPRIKGVDHAIWRRIRLVPFEVIIPDAEQDKSLPDKLRDELPGVLAWAVAGCLEWQREGLTTPDEVKAATADYRDSQDLLATFIAERCVTGDEYEVQAGPLYKAYTSWADDNGERAMTNTRFGVQLSERGYPREKRGNVYRQGISLRTDSCG